MIHETLFYLWHSPLSVLENEDMNNLFELEEFLHPGEQKLLQRITEIALDYHRIDAFTRTVLDQVHKSSSNSKTLNDSTSSSSCTLVSKPNSGLYTKAFCRGVDKVLIDYRIEITKLEDMFLQNPQLSLTFILSCVEKYRTLFLALKDIIQMINNEETYGCLLMGKLHKYIFCGVDQISTASGIIIKSVNTIFYRHLCNWIIYGDLLGNNDEFFICDGKTADKNFQYSNQDKKSKIRSPPEVRYFYINWKLVPMFIKESMAERILFTGRIVWIIRNDPRRKVSSDFAQNVVKCDIWEGKDIEYFKKVQSLEEDAFNAEKFHETIEICRLKLTKYLWSVMLEEGKLMEHLQLIRDYYALGRGELFQQFISVAENQIKDAKSMKTFNNLNYIFSETARKIYGENDKSYLRFELTNNNKSNEKVNIWSTLNLNFEISWPLHIVFHPKVMELYNKLFSFLMRLKKTQIDLNRLWVDHVAGKQKIDRRVWTLRQNLMFLINNLQYYLQVNVIEAQFSVLLKAVENANEFEDIIKVHHDFISNLLAKTFILTSDDTRKYSNKHSLYQQPALKDDVPTKVYNVITNLLQVCDEFCLVASSWSPELTEPELVDLDMLQKKSDTVIESLLFILFSLREKVSGQHLLQLLLQLDFNRYLSRHKTDHNITISHS